MAGGCGWVDTSPMDAARIAVTGGSATSCETAELLSEHGAKVAIVEIEPAIGMGIDSITRRHLIRKLRSRGVDIRTNARVTRIGTHRLLFMAADVSTPACRRYRLTS